ncbi:MAG: hypothetical protein SCJ97_02555 [Bacillota bacterium]|nr:hypothetical protein [Bacillota bacterium]
MKNCPDILVIQSIVDGECTDELVLNHIEICPSCRQTRLEMLQLSVEADRLNCADKLPDNFFEILSARINPKPFPAAIVAAVIFGLAIISAYFLNPGYLEWWLSVGITRQFTVFIDAFLGLFYLGQSLGPLWLVLITAALVGLEILILNRLKLVEGLK